MVDNSKQIAEVIVSNESIDPKSHVLHKVWSVEENWFLTGLINKYLRLWKHIVLNHDFQKKKSFKKWCSINLKLDHLIIRIVQMYDFG